MTLMRPLFVLGLSGWLLAAGCAKPAAPVASNADTVPAADVTTADLDLTDDSPVLPAMADEVEGAAGQAAEKQPAEPITESAPKVAVSPALTAPAENATAASGDAEQPAPGKGKLRVLLGSPELTAGIPGEGPLTIQQIQNWLAREENHLPLEVELPFGLAAGAASIQIPEDNPMTLAKIELGRQLYFDPRLSVDGTVSCADCHHPDEGYARATQFGVGIGGQTGNRNSPTSYNRILSTAQFWDGRAASLEEQAVGPIANPIEMGNTHDACIECLRGIEGYQLQFEKIFTDGMNIDNVGRAIASFERTIVTGPSPFDYYEPLRALEVALKDELDDLDALKEDDPELYDKYIAARKASEAHPISEAAKRGREIFFSDKGGCTACHVGPNLTDEKYHNLGVGMDQDEPDLGRFVVTGEEKDRGAFKTPTIRNVALTAPYMHDGSQQTLLEVVEWYDKGGHPNPHLSDGIRKLNLTDQEKQDLVAFMEACTGDFPAMETGRLPQ